MPIKVTYQNPGLEYDENMVCEDFLNMGMLPLEWLMIIIPIKWLFHWEYTLFSDKPTIHQSIVHRGIVHHTKDLVHIVHQTMELNFSPTAECFGVFSHSKGFGADRSSSKTDSPKVPRFQVQVPSTGSQVKVPRFPSKGSQGSLKAPKAPKVPQGSQNPKRFPKGSLKVPSRFPARFPSFPSKGCQGSKIIM